MNSSPLKALQVTLSGLSNWLIFFGVLWLLSAAGLGWLVNGLAVVFLVLLVVPVVGVFVGMWWLRRNTAMAACPVCGFEMTGIENMALACPSCGEALKMQGGQFERVTPPGTVEVTDVTVVDVTTVDVETKRLDATDATD